MARPWNSRPSRSRICISPKLTTKTLGSAACPRRSQHVQKNFKKTGGFSSPLYCADIFFMHWVAISPIAHGIDAYARGCNPNGLDRRRRRSIFAARAFHLACGDSLRLGLRPKHDPWGTTALSLESIGAFQILGWFAVLRLLYLQTSSAPPSRRDFWVAGVVGAIDLLPSGKATWIAATLAAIYIYAGNEKGSNGRAGAAVLGRCPCNPFGPNLI